MRSIRTKIIILNVVAIATAIITATVIAGVSVAKLGHSNSEEMLRLNCESGQSDLDHCFESVQQCVDFFADKVDDDKPMSKANRRMLWFILGLKNIIW